MRWTSAVLVLLLVSCGTEATSPLTPLSEAKLDKSLLGTWKSFGDGKPMTFVVTAVKGALLHVSIPAQKDKEAMDFEGHVSEVGAWKFLNLRAVERGVTKGNYVFVHYAVQPDGSMQVSLLRDVTVSAAVKAGELAGKSAQYGGTIIDDTPERMLAFLRATKEADLFEPLMSVKKSK